MVDTRRMLGEVRRRAIGSILTYCESASWYTDLDRAQKLDLRNKVLDSLALYHDCVLDVIKAIEGSPQEALINERAMELLEQIHRDVNGITVHGGGQPIALLTEAGRGG